MLALVLLCAGMLCPSLVSAQDLLLTESATVERGRIITIDHRTITWRDDAGELREMPRASCVALTTSAPPQHLPDAPGTMVLTDGQTLPGRIGLVSDRLIWRHNLLDEVSIDLASLRLLVLAPGVEPPVARDADVVLMTNGDRVTGIVSALGSTVQVDPVDGGPGTALPIERVAAVALVNPPRPLEGTTVWLADGTIMRSGDPRLEDDGLVRLSAAALGTTETSLLLPMESIAGVLFRPDLLVPLADLRPDSVWGPLERLSVPSPRRRTAWAPVGLVPVEFSGPCTVEYTLPGAGMRFLALAELPPSARTWGSLDMVLRDGEREILRLTLDGESPRAFIEVMVPGRNLTIDLLEGRNGPVQDTVILHWPLLLHGST